MAGKVYLIGAGPGDYKLLTLKAVECLRNAQVIVYDRLVNVDYLRIADENCEYINVGKASHHHTLPQEMINELLFQKAQEGKMVARLKGGDPYVFGRGGEEGEYLYDHGIDFEVVPGITSAIGGLCYAGIPITHRDFASSFHVVTGHHKDDKKESIDWEALVSMKGTLVFLMGMSNLKKISSNLLKAGMNPQTLVALISWASRSGQSVVIGSLETIYEKTLSSQIQPPTLIVVGEVVGLRKKLNFFEKKPLFGKRIVVTRARNQNSTLVEQIRDLGGEAIEFPTIEIRPITPNIALDKAISQLQDYEYLLLTSANAVDYFFKALEAKGFDSRALAHLKIAVIGSGTQESLYKRGIKADIMPSQAATESLVERLKPLVKAEDRLLLPHASLARTVIEEELEKLCKIDAIKIYETVRVKVRKPFEWQVDGLIKALQAGEIDYITFTSSSTVKYLIEELGEDNLELLQQAQLISIGAITSNTLRSYHLEPYKEAEQASLAALVDCMIENR